jgi:hypothetical protein
LSHGRGRHRTTSRGPIALADLFDAALKDLAPKPAPAHLRHTCTHAPGVRRCFPLQWQPARDVPRRLFLDRRLTPLERNAWQVFRLMLNDDGVTAFPTYEQLRPGWRPCPARPGLARDRGAGADAAAPDALAEPGAATARPQDRPHPRQPLRPARRTPDTVRGHAARPDYLQLVSQALGHSAKAVQIVGLHTLKEIGKTRCCPDAPCRRGCRCWPNASPTRHHGHRSYPQEDAIHDSEEGAEPSSEWRTPSSESEAGPKPAPDGSLRNPKQDRTVRSSRINEVRTTAQARALGDLQWPKRFAELKAEQQAGARWHCSRWMPR